MNNKICPKVISIKRKNYTSFIASCVINFRDPVSGYPVNRRVFSLPTVRSNLVHFPVIQKAFWERVERELGKLNLAGSIDQPDIDRIRRKFEMYVPMPSAKPAPVKKGLASRYAVLQGVTK